MNKNELLAQFEAELKAGKEYKAKLKELVKPVVDLIKSNIEVNGMKLAPNYFHTYMQDKLYDLASEKQVLSEEEDADLEEQINELGHLFMPLMEIGNIVGWEPSSLYC